MKLGKRTLCGGFVVVAALLAVDMQVPGVALGQQKFKDKGAPSFKKDQKFLAAFQQAVVRAAQSTVRVNCDGVPTTLGVIITADGYILTEAYDLTGKITVKLNSGEELEAKWVGHHPAHDLAMLKISAKDLTPIEWSDSKVAPVGNFVVSVGTGLEPVAVGVVSVATRNVPPAKGGGKKGGGGGGPGGGGPGGGGDFKGAVYLGIATIDDPKGAKVSEIMTGKGKGGKGGGGGGGGGKFGGGESKFKKDDIIVAFGDKAVKDAEALAALLKTYKAGDQVTVKLLRGDDEIELRITLNPPPAKGKDQNQMGSVLSKRITGFPTVLQHDSVVLPTDCGGPLVDLEGRVIGINIARVGRVESDAIPSETIRPLLADLMSGKLPPKTK